MERIASGIDAEKSIEFEEHDAHDLEERVLKIIREKPGLSENAYMGLMMKEFKGKVDAKSLMEMIRRHAGK